MAIHTTLPIYRSSYELLQLVCSFVKNFPKSVRGTMGVALHTSSMDICLLVAKANAAQDKVPHLDALLDLQKETELLIRLAKDMRFISLRQYSNAVEIADAIGKQAGGWKKASAPAAQQASLL